MRRLLLAVACALVLAGVSNGQVGLPLERVLAVPAGSEAARHLKVKAVASHLEVPAGGDFHVALVMSIADGWVYYSPDPGPTVLPGELDVMAGALEPGRPLWPKDKPKATDIGDETIVNNVYVHRAIVYVPIHVPDDAAAGAYSITLAPGGQICQAVCMNVEAVQATASVRVDSRAVVNPEWSGDVAGGLASAMTAAQLKDYHAGAAEERRPSVAARVGISAKTVWAGLGLALLAGLTLNIMPCVLPVIPLRILSIVAMARESRRRFVTLGLAFAGGMVLFFVGLAVVNIALRLATDQVLNVSDHFTYPAVRIAMAMVLIALAANLFGVFHVVVPSRVASLDAEARGEGHLKSAGMGLMMAVLATPCSFAYLLAAMAWAQVQPLWLGTVALVTIGVGMAAPHALLAAFPDMLKKLPRPGRWMELFKQAMGFLLLPVAIWLISTLGGDPWPFWVAAYGVVLAFCLWVWANWVRYDAGWLRKLGVRGLAVALAVTAGAWMLPKPTPPALRFEKFDESLIAAGRAEGRIVLVKVTASWCTECHIIDYRVYGRAEIADELRARNVLPIKADVSDRNSPASRWVRREFRGSPPLTIIYPPGSRPPATLVGTFTKQDLLDALDAAEGMSSAAGAVP